MNKDMFGTLPDGTAYTKRRNLWTKQLTNLVTYRGYECQKLHGELSKAVSVYLNFLPIIGQVGRDVHFTISFEYIYEQTQIGTTNPMAEIYCDGSLIESQTSSKWYGKLSHKGEYRLKPATDWTHASYTFSFNADKGNMSTCNVYPIYLRDILSDFYIRNIMITYGDEDYPYTPAPEIDETVVLTEGAG